MDSPTAEMILQLTDKALVASSHLKPSNERVELANEFMRGIVSTLEAKEAFVAFYNYNSAIQIQLFLLATPEQRKILIGFGVSVADKAVQLINDVEGEKNASISSTDAIEEKKQGKTNQPTPP